MARLLGFFFCVLMILMLNALFIQKIHAAEKITYKSFQKKLIQKNLDLKMEKKKAETAQARSIGLLIPAPMIGFTQMKDTMGVTANGYELSQSIPFFTKISSDYQARSEEAKSVEENELAKENEIFSEARIAYLNLWASQEKHTILLEKKQVVEDHIRLTRSTVRSDSFAGIHLLKAETDLDLIENEILIAKQEWKEQMVKAALILNEDPAKYDVALEEPPLTEQTPVIEVEKSHQLSSLKWGLEAFRSRETYAKSSWLPDFNLRYKQLGSSGSITGYNEVMLGITLPFAFFWQPYSESSQAISARTEAELNYEKQKRLLQAQKLNLESKVQSLKLQFITLKEKVLPKAEKRMKLIHNVAPRDLEALQDHRDTMEAFPDFKMRALQIRLEYENAVAELEKLSSTTREKSHE